MEGGGQGWAIFNLVAGALARIFDVSWVLVAALLAFWFRFEHWQMPLPFQAVTLIGALLTVITSAVAGVYSSWRGRRKVNLIGRLLLGYCFSWGGLTALLVVSHQADYFSRLWLGYWFVASVFGSTVFRGVVYYALNRMRTRGYNIKRVVIVGRIESIRKASRRLIENPWLGMELHKVRVIGDCPEHEIEWSLVDSNEALSQVLEHEGVHEVWICLPLSEERVINELLFDLRHNTSNIRYFPDLSGYRLLNHKATEVAGLYALDLSCSPLDGLNRYVKSLFDKILGLLILLCIMPILAVIALGVKLSSPGPVLFKQYRHGIDGRRINIYKFRSMKLHKEQGNQLTQANRFDDRVTGFGRFLRKTSLDELPQFFNVLQGKMSIVGPRPHALAHNEQYKELVESYMKRHKVKPGITGWAQVNGLRGETDTLEKMRKRVEYDLFYIENWSIAFDIKIIIMTFWKGFMNKNAF